ncbi:hypothetical protein Bbelb_089760 [Branchiostoma belcheri]|nr:hypothetical protein Bbelb_089760 [Branchiostoma belcheri]
MVLAGVGIWGIQEAEDCMRDLQHLPKVVVLPPSSTHVQITLPPISIFISRSLCARLGHCSHWCALERGLRRFAVTERAGGLELPVITPKFGRTFDRQRKLCRFAVTVQRSRALAKQRVFRSTKGSKACTGSRRLVKSAREARTCDVTANNGGDDDLGVFSWVTEDFSVMESFRRALKETEIEILR